MKVEIRGLNYGYGNVPVLQDINLELGEPGLTCIIGPNGVGKSTLIKCINKIHHAAAGTVFIDGYDVSEIPPKVLARSVGYVPVTATDTFSMSVLDTVLMGRHPHQSLKGSSRLDLEIAMRCLNMVGMSEFAMRDFDELSAGQHQKIAIARGLAQTPKLLILDEPTSNLDVRHQIEIAELLRDIARQNGMIILMICHDLNIASKFSDNLIMMARPGRIYAVGKPSELLTEQAVRDIYGVDCRIIDDGGSPHVILGRPLKDR